MDRITGRPFATRSEVLARHGMAATSQPLATQVAVDLLRRGGSAADAAIGANAMLGLVEPTGAGIGGDLFALVWDADGSRLHALNASGRSPRALTREHLLARGLERVPERGPLSVSVPGCVDGWARLHDRFGRLPWADVLAPAIAYAREGAPISETIAFYWAQGGPRLADQPGFEATFLPEGRAPARGESFQNPGLAATLQAIAAGGRDAFYRGEIAARIGAFCERVGGYLSPRDLEAHESTWETPLSTSYRGVEVWEMGPNTQGLAVLQMLNLLEPFDLGAMGFGSADHLHHLIEAKKIAYEDRARFYADPGFADLPVDRLASKAYAAGRRALLDPRHARRSVPLSDPRLGAADTVYLATADGQGQMVSLIQSNYRGFGSGLCPDGLGFGLQNRGELFALFPGHPNVYAPAKRPFHTIIPGFVTKQGEPWLAFGVMGGDMQPQGHVQILVNLLDFEMNLQEAGDAPRVRHGGSSAPTGERMEDGGLVFLESGLADAEAVRDLESRGHRFGAAPGGFGGFQAIRRDVERDAWIGASEARKDGQAAGF